LLSNGMFGSYINCRISPLNPINRSSRFFTVVCFLRLRFLECNLIPNPENFLHSKTSDLIITEIVSCSICATCWNSSCIISQGTLFHACFVEHSFIRLRFVASMYPHHHALCSFVP
jgi:hypothetical protein